MTYCDHHFRPALAELVGVDCATFLNNIYHWTSHNAANEKNYYEGRYWTYNSMEAFRKIFFYWSRRQIERIIATCKKEGLLLTGCFNEDPRDRTLWYTLTNKAMLFFCDGMGTESVDCNSQNGEMQHAGRCSTYPETVTPLPDNKPDNKQADTTPKAPQGGQAASRRRKDKSVPVWKPERFEAFWALYPRREDRVGAVREWDRLKPDGALLAVMGRALRAQMAGDLWRRGIGIPYACRWLKNRRWEDAPPQPAGVPSGGGGRVLENENVQSW